MNRYVAEVSRLLSSVLDGTAATPTATRQAVLESAKRAVAEPDKPLRAGAVEPSLTRYVETVARHAYRVTDADVQALKDAGHSEEAIFDITVSAALGSALYRMERGMAALHTPPGDHRP
jgi:alkylhydroperoxidase family enzyme